MQDVLGQDIVDGDEILYDGRYKHKGLTRGFVLRHTPKRVVVSTSPTGYGSPIEPNRIVVINRIVRP